MISSSLSLSPSLPQNQDPVLWISHGLVVLEVLLQIT